MAPRQTERASSGESAGLDAVARRIRGEIVALSSERRIAHVGSCLSCVDILVALYFGAMKIDPKKPADPPRDRFILSKGHAALALYATLFERGFFPEDVLRSCGTDGGCLAEHPGPGCAPGIEAATGSLGHGLPIGTGMALAAKIRKERHRVFVLITDGECNEGSVWEAALFAPAHGLDNLVAVIDYNRWQATGRSEEVMAIRPLREKWEAFGWNASEVDGHDTAALIEALGTAPDGSGRPRCLVAHTVKGKGISFMEDNNDWHYRIPTVEDVKRARLELGLS